MRGAKRGGRIAGAARLVVGLLLLATNLVLVNYLAARFHVRADWTGSGRFELSARSRQVLAGLEHRVRLTMLMAPPRRGAASLYQETRELLERLRDASRRVDLELVDLDLDHARVALLARRYSIPERELREGVVVVAAGGRSQLVPARALAQSVVRPGGRQTVTFHGEAAVLGALLTVTAGESPTVCATSGHGEPRVDSYAVAGVGHLADEIRRNGFKLVVLAPRALAAGAARCRLLLIVGPQRAFSLIERDAIDSYLRRGGRLLLLLGPILDRGVTRYRSVGVEPLLESWGVGLPRKIVIDPVGLPGEQPLLTWATRNGYGEHPVARALDGRLTVWPLAREVRPLSDGRAGLRAEVLVRSSARGWAESDLRSLRENRPTFDAAVDSRGPVPVAVAVSWRGTRLVVLGSERGVLNRRLRGDVVRDYNRDLVLAALGWLSGRRSRVAVGPKALPQLRLRLDQRQLNNAFLLTVVGLPLLALCTSLVVWWRRRR